MRFYFDIFYFDQYFDNPHDLDTKLFHFKSLEYSIPKIPVKLKFSTDFSKIRFFFFVTTVDFDQPMHEENWRQNSPNTPNTFVQMMYRELLLKIRLQRFPENLNFR